MWLYYLVSCFSLVYACNAGSPRKIEDEIELSGDQKSCTSVVCLKSAYDIKSAMDLSVDPCQDFYQFACGNFLNETRIPADKSSVDVFSSMGDDLINVGRDLLEETSSSGDEGSEKWKELDRLPRDLYKDCMDEETLEKLGLDPAKEILSEVGGWLGNVRPWQDVAADLRRLGMSANEYVVYLDVDIDNKLNEQRVIYVDQPDFGIEREYFLDDGEKAVVDAYHKYMVATAELLGGVDRKVAEEKMKAVFQLESEMARAATPKEERRDENRMYNPHLLGDVPRKQGHPPSWVTYVNRMVADIGGVPVNGAERVIVKEPAYLDKLAAILDRAGNETINAYLVWRSLQSGVVEFLNKDARRIKHEFERVTEGKKEESARFKQCAKVAGVDSLRFGSGIGVNLLIGSMYVRRHLKPPAREQLVNMTNYARRAFKKVLDDVDWMDQETKDKAYLKLENMLQNIGYPDEVIDVAKMSELHQGLKLEKGHYFKSILAMDKFWAAKSFALLRSHVDRTHWLDNPIYIPVAVVNAFYNPSTNSMSFPAGFLFGRVFNADAPAFMNYGGIGTVIGHEISHGFDDEGRLTDETGILKNWWSNKTAAKFTEKASCVIAQYGDFEAKEVGLKLNGINTQGENIADIVGNKIAHMAYEFWTADHGVEPDLPGLLEFNPRQMFWISNARLKCAKYTEAKLRKDIITDSHSPMEFRTKGPVINLETFAKDFNCPAGSPMNPAKRCQVW